MRIGWIGFHTEGVRPFRAVLDAGVPIVALVTLTPEHAATRSGAADYGPLCHYYGVPQHVVANINDDDAVALLESLDLDLAFVIGWTQLVRAPARTRVRRGLIGAHASMLPALRGRAPVNWALIRGLSQTGNTLFWLADAADQGDIIDQRTIAISPYDTCASLYDKVAESSARMILDALPALMSGERPARRQPAIDEPALPARRPEDGVIDWARPAMAVYDTIRALTRPYPGAFSWLTGRRYRIWDAALLPEALTASTQAPGTVLGPVWSPRAEACGLAVACWPGAVLLLELEDDAGAVLRGRRLSECPWTGHAWEESHEVGSRARAGRAS